MSYHRILFGSLSLAALSFSQQFPVNSPQYSLQDSYIGNDFFGPGWKWETFDDPTHGRVNYVDQDAARSSGLSYVIDNKFFMRADAIKILNENDRGRDSIRISSNNAYSDTIIVLDLSHMPEGCSTWPAFWTLSHKGPWPQGGEIDIIEGVNLDDKNLMSLHTTPGCSVPQDRSQTGQTVSTNCDSSVDYNEGCGTKFSKPASYGVPFNQNGGGYFAMKKSSDSVKGWFWPRNDPNVPSEISCPDARDTKALQSDGWGTPDAFFPTDSCDHNNHFDEHSMVFDLTFCGDWAGSSYGSDGKCPGNCIDFVNNNPKSFENAYWEINSLRIYTAN